ncbi:acyl transferase [Ekhidna sp.]|uniref:LuxE/PaaK family acyltransferase n=1 Tax=Ekhidna sp. TaxID=2608089 RepID=UPI003CCC1EEE
MSFAEEFKHTIFDINEKTFVDSSLKVFEYQYRHCNIYQEYCKYLNKNPKNVKKLTDIPFIPIEFFKNHAIKSGDWSASKIFKSSGTTETGRSKHYVRDESFYHSITTHTFEHSVNALEDLQIIALLPSYQEQGQSSLINMVDHFIHQSDPSSGYYLDSDIEQMLHKPGKKLIIGVSYALLDLVESKNIASGDSIIMETGGMKGRRKEITREDLHNRLKTGFNTDAIWSEYGMTELFSQAYGENGKFKFPSWAKCLIRDINDPFSYLENQSTGGINIIDLGNIDTCSFIETKDLGRVDGNHFEVLGRFDNSDIRGCNLLV